MGIGGRSEGWTLREDAMPYSKITTCMACGANNRISAKHLADVGRCGVCKSRLAPINTPIEVDPQTLHDIVTEAKVPVLVDFYAPWCGPCRSASTQVHDLAAEMAGDAIVLKVNTDTHPELAAHYKVQSIPNFVVFRKGKPALQRIGLVPRREMHRWLEPSTARAGSGLDP